MTSRPAKLVCAAAALLIFVAGSAWPQAGHGKGRQAGTVAGPDGQPVVGAKVTLRFAENKNLVFETTSGKNGDWSFLGPGTGNWFLLLGGLNAGGCDGSGSGFDCAHAYSTGPFNAVPGPTYVWVFDINVGASSLLTAENAASIKARYVDANGGKVGALVSENITLQQVPEPASLAVADEESRDVGDLPDELRIAV